MATPSVLILGRTYLPGPGFTTSGTPKQGKTMTWGRMTGTYDGSITVSPNSFGLTTVDHVSFQVIDLNGNDVTAGEVAGATYRPDAGTVEIFSDASTEGTTQTFIVTFFAVGDSARDVESLA